MRKMSLLFLLMGLFIFLSGGVVFAGEGAAAKSSDLTVEKAIGIAKEFFPETKKFSKFDSNYEQREFASIWALRWYQEKEEDSLNVEVNATTGEIVGFNFYDPAEYRGSFSSIPKVSRAAGEKIARDFIKKISPAKAGEITLKEMPENNYSSGPVFHYYTFVRTIGGIAYPNNIINITINGQTGAPRNLHINWEEKAVEAITPKLSLAEANKIFTEKSGFLLKYFMPPAEGNKAKPIKAIYEINNPYQVAIDALTGEMVLANYYEAYANEGMKDAAGSGERAMESGLEPFEQEIADELKTLISREKAMEIAQKTIDLPSGYKLESSSLNRDWSFPELRVWSFYWAVKEKDSYGWASVELDAKTGKVLAFNFQEPEKHEQVRDKGVLKIKNKDEAAKIVENFLQENYPETMGNLQVSKDYYDVRPSSLSLEEEKNQPSYYFGYERLVGEVPFRQNYVYANVNSFSGKIDNFQIRFLDLTFPGTGDVLDKTKFTQEFLNKNPLTLVYMRDQEGVLRLVYKLADLDSYRFDARSGQKLDYRGQPLADKKIIEITDIQGHWAAAEIKILNQMGFLHHDQGAFQPNGKITQAEVIKALVKSSYSYLEDSQRGNWYDDYYREARQMGLILAQEVNPGGKVTREQLAKFMARGMVKDKIAQLNIYQISFKDKGRISKGHQGYVAIIHGLGIMSGDGVNFHPQNELKKGEACVALMRYLKTER